MHGYPFLEYPLDVQLQSLVDAYAGDLSKYWDERLNLKDWSQINQLLRDAESIANCLRNRALALQNIGDASDINSIYEVCRSEEEAAKEHVTGLLDGLPADIKARVGAKGLDDLAKAFGGSTDAAEPSDRPKHAVWQYLCITEAREACADLRDRASRIFELNQLVDLLGCGSALPPASKQFLALVGRSFVYGFDAECVIVCRGVIDTAFQEKVPLALLKSRRTKRKDRYGLQDRIEAAFPDLLDKRTKEDAHAVRLKGDRAIHYDPHATRDVIGTIRQTLHVVNRLGELPDAPGEKQGL